MSILSLHSLELWTRIGVPEIERATPQRILVTLHMEVKEGAGKSDALKDTVDYESVYTRMKILAKEERKTLERFAEDIASTLLKEFSLESIEVTLQKFILPGTAAVSVTISRP